MSLRNPVYFAPGTSWHYSNTNYILLGMVAEDTKTTLISIVDSDTDNPNDVSLAALKVLFE